MKITILTDNPNSWILKYVEKIKSNLKINNELRHIYSHADIQSGDIMFLLGCEKILSKKWLNFHKNNIVVHESNVPKGKGFSPLSWQIYEGKSKIKVCLLEVSKKVDSGNIYLSDYINLEGDELNEEIKELQGLTTVKLILKYVNNYKKLQGIPQSGKESFYPRRTSKDNELDVNKSIKKQFNIFRISDNEKYPAHFYIHGKKYILKIFKSNN